MRTFSNPAGYFLQSPMSPTAPGTAPSTSAAPLPARRSHEMATPKTRSRLGTPVSGVRPKSGTVKDAAVHAWLTKVEPEGA